MFRFLNIGLRHSVTTFQSPVYHVPIHQRLWENDDNDNEAHKALDVIHNKMTPLYINPRPTLTSYLWNVNELLERRDWSNDIRSLHSWTKFCDGQFKKIQINDNRMILEKVGDTAYVSTKSDADNCENNSCTKNHNNIDAFMNVEKNCHSDAFKDAENECHRDTFMGADNHNTHFLIFEHLMNEKGCAAAERSEWISVLEYWKCASSMNYPPSQFNLGVYYESHGDMEKAEKWYRAAVDSGDHPTASYNLAILLNNKNNTHLKDEIVRLLHKSAKGGIKEALRCIEYINN